jgi:hypothetical protein
MATFAAANNSGFEWRTLLGPTDDWPMPAVEASTTKQPASSVERCELCGDQVGDGRPFTTNSAGQRAMHVRCLGEPGSTRKVRQPAGKILQDLLKVFSG